MPVGQLATAGAEEAFMVVVLVAEASGVVVSGAAAGTSSVVDLVRRS